MKADDWIDAKATCELLGVKPQTLYAYVSRHNIRVQSDPSDARASLYSRNDIDHLLRQKRRPRAREDVAQAAIRWGDPVLSTAISEIRDGTLWLRGHAIEHCAEHMSLEEVAALLCDVDSIPCPATREPVLGSSVFSRAMKAIARETDTSQPLLTLSTQEIASETGRMISVVADACLGQPCSGPIHKRVGQVWRLAPSTHDMIRQALVLLSDHELNPSTFAVRVCASTGASLPAALLAGMATLSGPRHGGATNLAMQALMAQLSGGLQDFLHQNKGLSPYAFGFGHPLYPQGDPRAAHLLRLLPNNAPEVLAVMQMTDHLNQTPNIDMALAALSLHLRCPDNAGAVIFSIGRVAGWAAHAIEQMQGGALIRPRAKFQHHAVEDTAD